MKTLWLLGGHLSLGLGCAGIFLPVLPTTPFILLAAYCYSRGSERCHTWLITHKRFGPLIADWQAGQVIRPRIKCLSVGMMLLFVSYPLFVLALHDAVKIILGVVVIWVCWFILSRPSEPPLSQNAYPDTLRE